MLNIINADISVLNAISNKLGYKFFCALMVATDATSLTIAVKIFFILF